MKYLIRLFCGLSLTLFWGGCAHRLPETASERKFNYATDHLAYANETVWRYDQGRVVEVKEKDARKGDAAYATRCFVVTRSTLQFWKFARFDSRAKTLSDEELAERLRILARIDVWKEPYAPAERIVFPGYANLYQLSKAKPLLLQKNLGAGWPIFVRPGNTSMVFPPSRAHQERTFGEVKKSLSLNYPIIVWLVRFPELDLNHSVLVYGIRTEKNKTVFTVYDPNDVKKPKELYYDPATRTFSFQPTFYFKGGPVDVRTIYWSPGQ